MKTRSEFVKDFKKTVRRFILEKDLSKTMSAKPLDDTLVQLRKFRNKYDGQYDNLRLEITTERYYDPYGTYNSNNEEQDVIITLVGDRRETYGELIERIDKEYKQYQNHWDHCRKEYERYKNMFENNE